MNQGGNPRKSFLCILLAAAIGLVFLPGMLESQQNPTGRVIGYVYGEDGNTPLRGAVVKLKNIATGRVYESVQSDDEGFFKVEGVERGVYVYGVLTPDGAYNSEGLLGLKLRENETAKMSIALTPYKKEVTSSMEEFYQDLELNGESYVGKVLEFDPVRRIARVYVERGYIQVKDKIRAKGERTDFTQNVNYLESNRAKVKRVYAGETATLKLNKKAEPNDLIFVVKKTRFLPFFFKPWGAVSVLAASGAVIYGITNLTENAKPCSPKRHR